MRYSYVVDSTEHKYYNSESKNLKTLRFFHALGIEITETRFTFVIFKVRYLLLVGLILVLNHHHLMVRKPNRIWERTRWNFDRKEIIQKGCILWNTLKEWMLRIYILIGYIEVDSRSSSKPLAGFRNTKSTHDNFEGIPNLPIFIFNVKRTPKLSIWPKKLKSVSTDVLISSIPVHLSCLPPISYPSKLPPKPNTTGTRLFTTLPLNFLNLSISFRIISLFL